MESPCLETFRGTPGPWRKVQVTVPRLAVCALDSTGSLVSLECWGWRGKEEGQA